MGARSIRTWRGNMVLTGVDQLWVADITYIRLRDEFVFLAVILDAYSRRVIGWALDRTLEDELTLARYAWRWRGACSRAGAGASFRPRLAVRQQRLHRSAERPTASTSACRARAIRGTTRPANRS